MAGLPPTGEPAPRDGGLPEAALATIPERTWSFYLHVPYCATRCGYCDFNTYTADELGPDVSRATWADSAIAEIALSKRVVGNAPLLHSIFVGGGTPTLLPSADLTRVLDALRDTYGFADDIEITTEANPDSVTPESLAALRAGGFNRISFGMQSTSSNVLRVLDRTHQPGRAMVAVQEAKSVGFDNINLDLIFGTPGETDDDLRRTLDDVLAADVQHISAYALIVESGTRLAKQIERGEVAAPDDDVQADRYELIDDALHGAGYAWYEISNWARDGFDCRHNRAYWVGGNWWGVGPGAHSHIGGVRWWNARHPATWTAKLAGAESPAQAREAVTPADQTVERIMLQTRIREGLSVWDLEQPALDSLQNLLQNGLIEDPRAHGDRVVLTRRGRLLADVVVHALLP